MQPDTRNQLTHELWAYFYDRDFPPPAVDDKPWRAIENAVCRITESEPYLRPSTPADVQIPHARQIRASARTAQRQIRKLSVAPEPWTIEALQLLEASADAVIAELSRAAEQLVVH